MMAKTENNKDQRDYYFGKNRVFIDVSANTGIRGKHFSKRFLQWCKRMVRTVA